MSISAIQKRKAAVSVAASRHVRHFPATCGICWPSLCSTVARSSHRNYCSPMRQIHWSTVLTTWLSGIPPCHWIDEAFLAWIRSDGAMFPLPHTKNRRSKAALPAGIWTGGPLQMLLRLQPVEPGPQERHLVGQNLPPGQVQELVLVGRIRHGQQLHACLLRR